MSQVAKVENQEAALVPSDPMVSMIERMVSDPAADLDKLERMLQMKRELEADQQRKDFNEAFSSCQSQIPQVLKNRKNDQTRSNYADLAAIEKAVGPVISEHGLSVRFFPTRSEIEGHMGVDCVVSHVAGHSETYHADVPSDGMGMKGNANKTATHAFGSTMSYGRRYLLCMIFNIATTDDDDGNTAKALVTAEQYIQLRDKAEEAGVSEEKICLAFGASSFEQFPSNKWASAIKRLEATIKNKKEQSNA